jgi:hypothetical protein
MRKGMEKWLTVQGYKIHKFPGVRGWDKPQSKAAGNGKVVPARQA